MPRRLDDLFGEIASFRALREAALRAVRGKRRKPGAAAFFANLERELLRLERQLNAETWRPGAYNSFEVHDPKPRHVSAAPFRDRVVQHALCAVIEPMFERGFIDDSFANRVGKGTHRAVARYEHFRDRYRQLLDDWRAALARYLEGRRLVLHPRKTMILPSSEPTAFLGLVVMSGNRRRLPAENVRRFRNRLRSLRDRWRAGTVTQEEVEQRVGSWVTHAAHADTWRLRWAIFRGGWFDPL